MKALITEIKIEASPEKVWAVLMDFESYPEWNPFLTEIKGEAKVGAVLNNTIRQKDNKSMQFQPEVLVADNAKEFRWKGKLFVKGLFDGEHYFQLERDMNNHTRLIHGEKFSGLLVAPLMKMIGADTEAGFMAMNQALKVRVESMGKEVRHAS